MSFQLARQEPSRKVPMSDKKNLWAKLTLWLLPLVLTLPAMAVPRISSMADVQLPEDTYCDGVSYTVTDPEFANDLLQLRLTAHSSNPSVVPDENIKIVRAGYSGLVKFLPLTNVFGTATITVTVANPNGASDSTSFTCTIVAENDPPTLDSLADMILTANAGPQTVPLTGITSGATNEFQYLTVTAYATPPGILTNLQVTYTSPNSAGTLSFEPVNNASGKATVDVFIEDGGSVNGLLARSFVVQVNAANLPPSISAISDQMTDLNTAKVINFIVGDKETAANNLSLTATSSNPMLVPAGNVSFGGSGSNRTATVTPATGQSGLAQITITVSDAQNAQAQSTFNFTVRPDALKPVISVQPKGQTVAEGSALHLSAAAVGEAPLMYQWQHNGTALSLQTNASLEITNVHATDAGAYTVEVTNSKGSVTSLPAQVVVVPAPSFIEIDRSQNGTTLLFDTVEGVTYSIEYRNSLSETNWNLLDVQPGIGGAVSVTDPGAKFESRFYRLRVN